MSHRAGGGEWKGVGRRDAALHRPAVYMSSNQNNCEIKRIPDTFDGARFSQLTSSQNVRQLPVACEQHIKSERTQGIKFMSLINYAAARLKRALSAFEIKVDAE